MYPHSFPGNHELELTVWDPMDPLTKGVWRRRAFCSLLLSESNAGMVYNRFEQKVSSDESEVIRKFWKRMAQVTFRPSLLAHIGQLDLIGHLEETSPAKHPLWQKWKDFYDRRPRFAKPRDMISIEITKNPDQSEKVQNQFEGSDVVSPDNAQIGSKSTNVEVWSASLQDGTIISSGLTTLQRFRSWLSMVNDFWRDFKSSKDSRSSAAMPNIVIRVR